MCFHFSYIDWGMKHEAVWLFFDVEEYFVRLSGLDDQLESFSRTVNFEVFRLHLKKALAYSDKSKSGVPPFRSVLVFEVLIIQTLNNLSGGRATRPVPPVFMRFLDLDGVDEFAPVSGCCDMTMLMNWR